LGTGDTNNYDDDGDGDDDDESITGVTADMEGVAADEHV